MTVARSNMAVKDERGEEFRGENQEILKHLIERELSIMI